MTEHKWEMVAPPHSKITNKSLVYINLAYRRAINRSTVVFKCEALIYTLFAGHKGRLSVFVMYVAGLGSFENVAFAFKCSVISCSAFALESKHLYLIKNHLHLHLIKKYLRFSKKAFVLD